MTVSLSFLFQPPKSPDHASLKEVGRNRLRALRHRFPEGLGRDVINVVLAIPLT
jgi:hypothetical protein